jgi:uncharacterized membrane protein YgcG
MPSRRDSILPDRVPASFGRAALAGAVCAVAVLVTTPGPHAQRRLSWDALDVEARLDADGVLQVTEIQSMLFTGDWNGGERVFNLRPRQRLTFDRIERLGGSAPIPLARDSSLDDVDEYAFTDRVTLRWRSRMPADPPFARTRLAYALHYQLTGILRQDGDTYTLDHDFAFPDRDGDIQRYTLRLTLDPVWRPVEPVRESYAAGPLLAGDGFVLTIPMRYTGAGTPEAIDVSRTPEIKAAVGAIVGFTALGVLWLFIRERSLGRFEPVVAGQVDRGWIERHILSQPAEVIGAAWDEHTGADEVVALIARMTSEGKLESTAGDAGSMTLRLLVDRHTLTGQEWALVNGLFFDGRTVVSTHEIKAHYRDAGFNPAALIEPEIQPKVSSLLPAGDAPRIWGWINVVFFFAGGGLLALTAFREHDPLEAVMVAAFAFVFIGVILQFPSYLFRSQIDWGIRAAVYCVLPVLLVALGAAAFLWYVVGSYRVELSPMMVGAIAALALGITQASMNGMKSRRGRAALAFRKKLAAAREYFRQELEKPIPALRDDWYPWLLAFGLGHEVDRWSTSRSSTDAADRWRHESSSSTGSSSDARGGGGWTGGGGRSGGAGASGSWAAAASGMAAGVAAPSSSSSGGGSSSSSGGSSGGGGGGGW